MTSEIQQDITIKTVFPELDGGRYPVKTEIDVPFKVTASIINKIPVQVHLKFRIKHHDTPDRKVDWTVIPMKHIHGTNKWEMAVTFNKIGTYQYTVETNPVKNKELIYPYRTILEVTVDPVYARYAAWYEIFPRSQGKIPGKSATFKDCEERLTDIKKMGFDVVYLTPVHPIGTTNRKGPNNTPYFPGSGIPGCPWAIGDATGGHKSVHPELGTLADFKRFVKKANKLNIEIALDIAFQCSPDHPYVKEHPKWFHYQPDGTIKYAENPPKKYEDVYPLNFLPEGPGEKENMWNEMKSIFVFWREQGIKIFRVDNPHTKPTEFWEWVITETKKDYPDVIFLSEAFTEYMKLELLAKSGFSQSYTYFTWRNTKNELIEYFMKLTNSYLSSFLRANLFANTPDILPKILQVGGQPAFKIRFVLASTLSSLYGIYSGFELLEHEPTAPGKEDYLNSEKYEHKVRDWNKPGNIKDFIAKINYIRKQNPALHYYDNLRIYNSTNEHVLFYGKTSPDNKNTILVAVNLDPFTVQTSRLSIPVEQFDIGSAEEYKVKDLINDEIYTWKGRENTVVLDPFKEPAHILKIEK
jgi:starch synthase (maltosyl-transferring)